MSIQTLALAFLAATAIGGVAWVFIYPLLSGERKAESRRASIARDLRHPRPPPVRTLPPQLVGRFARAVRPPFFLAFLPLLGPL